MTPYEKAFQAWFDINHPFNEDFEKEEVDDHFYKKEICKAAFLAGVVVGKAQ